MKKKLLSIVVVLGILFAPKVAQAATFADLDDAIVKSIKLCNFDIKQYAKMCDYAQTYKKLSDSIIDKTANQQNEAIRKAKPDFTSTYKKINETYVRAIADKKISAEGIPTTVGSSFSGDCNNGGVRLGVGIKTKDECVGGNGENPIYAYLRGIILIFGSVIGIAIVITFIVAGIQYAASSGEPANIAKAKDRIFNAVIGLILYIMLAAVLRYLIPNVFPG